MIVDILAVIRRQNNCYYDAEYHLTPEEPGELASRAGVKQLVAAHIPFITKSPDEDAKYVSRISAKFAGTIMISEDLAEY